MTQNNRKPAAAHATSLIVVGGGGHAREVRHFAEDCTQKFDVIGYLDDLPPADDDRMAAPYLGNIASSADHLDASFVVAVGSTRLRRDIVRRLSAAGVRDFATLVHRDTTVSGTATLGAGVQISPGARITTHVTIGAHTIINQNATIGHDCQIGAFVTLAPNVAVSGNARLEDGVEIGTQASLRQCVSMGRGSMAGMGAVIIRDIDANTLVVGNPARTIRQLDDF